jgi:enamine deaminase RidA (YjgF/YER057c/UK114 family)
MAGKIITSEKLARMHGVPDLVRSGSFSPGVKAGPFVFVSGCSARDTSQDIRRQTEEAFEYMSMVLAEAGCSLGDVVKLLAFVADPEDYPGYNEVRRRYFPKDPPGSATVVSDLLFPGMRVEVEAVAYKE